MRLPCLVPLVASLPPPPPALRALAPGRPASPRRGGARACCSRQTQPSWGAWPCPAPAGGAPPRAGASPHARGARGSANARQPANARRGDALAPGGGSPAGGGAAAWGRSRMAPPKASLPWCRPVRPRRGGHLCLQCWRSGAQRAKRSCGASIAAGSSGRTSAPPRSTTTTSRVAAIAYRPMVGLTSTPSKAAGGS